MPTCAPQLKPDGSAGYKRTVVPSVGILVGKHGRGSNMRRIIEASKSGEIGANVQVVIATSAEAPALALAENQGIAAAVVEPGPLETYGDRLLHCLDGVDLVCLAGYMRLLPERVVEAFSHRCLNIHPALLPKFGGKGMYGMNVHEAVVAAGELESGCTVHWVTAAYDEGATVLQLRCPVLPDDTAEALAARVLQLEHQAYPLAIQRVLHGEP